MPEFLDPFTVPFKRNCVPLFHSNADKLKIHCGGICTCDNVSIINDPMSTCAHIVKKKIRCTVKVFGGPSDQ